MRQAKGLALVTVGILAVLLGGCGKKDGGNQTPSAGPAPQESSRDSAVPAAMAPPAPAAPSPGDLAAAAAQNRQALAQMNQGKLVAAVPAATLKELLPEKLAGMKRTDASAERNQTMGVDMTNAHASYEGENEASLSLSLTDAGSLTGPMRMGLAGWTMGEFSRETDTGYERTGTFHGYKGVEQYDTQDKAGSVRIFVADRFVVEVEGNGVTMETLKQALGQLDLKKMATLASGS